ncbi:hypothetical protein CDV36_013756 [Fusarium kuroshium]|uniref:Uncharacterized protein n=1 Tax=Fusarium kuroshium TaxID=2010991 RepID=A0A3M2RN60_9HYPO|nr:hypothetical protein CDV36_013756 [Fusarium kuroshium]
MNFGGASSPSGLRPPVSSASPSGSNNTTTGRPQLWTPSSQRKVSRLYLYTTLSLDKIMAVVHAKSPDPVPGIESANKKLNSLLNKQPRWLHPRNEEDMGRRLDELALSPTRTTSSWNSINSQARSPNNSIPSLNPNPTPHLMRNNGISPTLEVPPFNQFPTQQQQHIPNRSVPPQQHTQNRFVPPQQARAAPNQQQNHDGVFQRFLRSTSFMSASTDCTTGTLHRLLNDYSDAYVKSVKRLVKRYTAPVSHRGASLSPISDDEPSDSTWMNDSDTPPPLPNGPDHLPGEFLLLDELFGQQPPCFAETEQHIKKSCLCRPNEQIQEPAWVTVRGLSNGAQRMVQYNNEGMKVEDRDPFGNTILHLMAARGMKDHLFQALLLNPNPHILNAQNTAGQTLLHVLHRGWFYNETFLCELLRSLAQRNFDFGARDHYGRSFSHILLARDVSPGMRNFFLQICQYNSNCTKRDAFNVTPTFAEPTVGINRAYTQAMDLDPPVPASVAEEDDDAEPYHVSVVAREARLIEFISRASDNPGLEDAEGRNGLHCLAAATLSKSSVLHKHDLDEKGEPNDKPRRKDRTPKDLDSCTERYNLRLSLLEGLLERHADPNHYDIHGYTPLMAFAAQLPEDDDYKVGGRILHKLVEAGADINARNRSGETALHVAVRCGRKLAVKQLVEDGASVHARDAAGRSVLDVADIKMKSLGGQDTEQYAHLEACRAWLSGQTGKAVQNPTVMQEWGVTMS